MKPEHFLYKSDGLYYMQNVPEEPKYVITDGVNRPHVNYMFDIEYDAYNKAIERAKEEAVKVDDPYIYQMAMHRYFPHHIDYSKTPKDNFAMCAEQGCVYTINMEEKIEVVNQYRYNLPHSGWSNWADTPYEDLEDGDLPNYEYRKIARIAAPKKEEESEAKDSAIRALFNLFGGAWHHCTDDEEDKIIEAIKEKFEIKRKAL